MQYLAPLFLPAASPLVARPPDLAAQERAEVELLGQRFAECHEAARIAMGAEARALADSLATDAERALNTLGPAAGARLRAWLQSLKPQLAPLLLARVQAGRVRELHGDGPEAGRRTADVLEDAAAQVADLLAQDRPALAWAFLASYLDRSGDHGGVALLRPYIVLRALRRAAAEPGQAAELLGAAERIVDTARPRLLVTHRVAGAPAAPVTAALLAHSGALRLRSETERQRIAALCQAGRLSTPLRGGPYDADCSARTYDRMLQFTRLALRTGWSVIVEASFLHRSERDRFRAAALAAGAPWCLLECVADAPTDEAPSADASPMDSRLDSEEPLGEDERPFAIVVRADRPFDAAAIADRWMKI